MIRWLGYVDSITFYILQIADFGMSRGLKNENYYASRGGEVPIKWTAPEVCIVRA